MRIRGLNKRIDIYETLAVADGFGGNTFEDILITSTWADIKNININSTLSTEFGVLEASNSLIVKLRKRNDLKYNLQTMFMVYRGKKYYFKSYPTNLGFEDSYITFIAQMESIKNVRTTSDLALTALANQIALNYMIRVNEDGGTIEDFDYLVSQIKLDLA